MYKVDDIQLKFLKKMKEELEPKDEGVTSFLIRIITDREYNDFQKKILKDLRARWIRQEGLHLHNPELERELEGLNRRKR